VILAWLLQVVPSVPPAGTENLVASALSGLLGSGPLVAVLAALYWQSRAERIAASAEVARLNAACKECSAGHSAAIERLYREFLLAVREAEREERGGDR
jgi:uncharacterized small protein (DUF1192 family)